MSQGTLFYVIDFFVIMAACIAAAWIERKYDQWKNRKLDIGCDKCQAPTQLAKTPDKQYFLCRECYTAYVREHFPNLDPNLRKIFRRIRRRK
jgi:hypothetical protein